MSHDQAHTHTHICTLWSATTTLRTSLLRLQQQQRWQREEKNIRNVCESSQSECCANCTHMPGQSRGHSHDPPVRSARLHVHQCPKRVRCICWLADGQRFACVRARAHEKGLNHSSMPLRLMCHANIAHMDRDGPSDLCQSGF